MIIVPSVIIAASEINVIKDEAKKLLETKKKVKEETPEIVEVKKDKPKKKKKK